VQIGSVLRGYVQQLAYVLGHRVHGHVVQPTAMYGWQTPNRQKLPGPQTLVHEPQWKRSVLRSATHEPPHVVVPAGHVATHVPLAQVCPALHARPHVPQFIGSSWRLRHVVPQPGATPQSV
jgi:hypothetical protein